MLTDRILEQINLQLKEVLGNNPLPDMEKNLKAILMAIFNKLNLVTREEFDIQQKVLLATRQRLEELEQQVKQLIQP